MLKSAVNTHAPDPFDHGIARLKFRSASPVERSGLSDVLADGWNVHGVQQICAFDRHTPYSNVYRVDTEEGEVVLRACKTLHVAQQQVVDLCKTHAAQRGLPVPLPRPTVAGQSFFQTDRRIYSLCDFVDGAHFNGSVRQLQAAAGLLARFHAAFQDDTHASLVETVNGDVYPLDQARWRSLQTAAVRGPSEFDRVAANWTLIVDEHELYFRTDFGRLPRQIGHFDWHPHNLIFSPQNDSVVGVLDFDLLRRSERARDVALAMHKFSRVFGRRTEDGQDPGATVESRCRQFLDAYQDVLALSADEIRLMPDLLFDEAKRKLIYILGKHYELNDSSSDFDIKKHVVQICELPAIRQALSELPGQV